MISSARPSWPVGSGHDAYEVLRQEHFAACRAAVATHHGTEIKTTGDGLMLCFASAADAVACGVALQQAR